jgi:hypothetical protein
MIQNKMYMYVSMDQEEEHSLEATGAAPFMVGAPS